MTIFNKLFTLWACIVLAGCVSMTTPPKTASIVTDETFGRYHENLESDLILITMTPEYHALYTELQPVPMSGDLPVRYTRFLEKVESDFDIQRVANWPLPAIDVFCVVFRIDDSARRDIVIAGLKLQKDIETAQLVQTFDSQAQDYNDPYLPMQHGLHAIQAINSHQWTRGEGTTVAIIDTGMDDTHPDLVASSDHSMNFVDRDEAVFRSDAHGTAVGGVIAAEANNDTGMVGIAPDAAIIPIKACWEPDKNSRKARCNTLTLAKALNYAIKQNVDVINLSLTGPPDQILERLVLTALEQGIVVVGAKPDHDNDAFPVSIEGTMAVGTRGAVPRMLTAPGRSVLSTQPNEQYDFFDGSSFATAHVAGLAALVRSLIPDLTPADIHTLIQQTSNPATGEVNACRAVQLFGQLIEVRPDSGDCTE